MKSRGDSVEVYWARDPIDAHAVHALLADAGMEAWVENESLQGAFGELPEGPSVSPRVRVPGEDAARARALIAEWQAGRDEDSADPQPPWKCAACGEEVEGNFDICWNCGAEKTTPPA